MICAYVCRPLLIRLPPSFVQIVFQNGRIKGADQRQPRQMALYYIIGISEGTCGNSPLLEIFRKKDIEVLILDDNIEEIVFSNVQNAAI